MADIKTAGSRYEQLSTLRTPYVSRAEEAAELTIPSLFPKDGHSAHSDLPTPYQGLGGRGVNNLASKLLMALIPPNSPFFRLTMDDYTLQEMTQQEGMRAEVEEALATIERTVMHEIEANAVRVDAFEALKQLIVTGNVLLYLPPEGGMRVFRLSNYVVKRDPSGNVTEIIVKETVDPDVLPEVMRALVKNEMKPGEKTVDLFTKVTRKPKNWEVFQEVKGERVPNTKGTYPLEKSPWIPLRYAKIDGEDYGRGFVEEYLGDLRSLEALTQAIVEGSAAAAKVLFLVNPNGTTDERDLAESPNGAIRPGNSEDVGVVHMEKFNDFRVAFEASNSITERLSFSFLLNTAIQRKAERVTAEEIRYMAGELEDALGGVYSILSQEFQLPLIRRLMHQMEKTGRLPRLPEDAIQPTIVTGLEALGRGHDLNKLTAFIQQLIPLGPEVLAQYMNVGDYVKRVGTSLGIDMDGLIKTEEEVQRAQQQAQMAQMVQQLGPEAIKAGSEQMKAQQQGNN